MQKEEGEEKEEGMASCAVSVQGTTLTLLEGRKRLILTMTNPVELTIH